MRWITWLLLVAVIDVIMITRVGARLGGGGVLVWLGLAAVLGILAIRTRGFIPASRRREQTFLDRVLIIAAGLLLIFPGPMSDIAGLALLIPKVRRRLAEQFRRNMAPWASAGGPGAPPPGSEPKREFPGASRARDVEFQHVENHPSRGAPKS